MVHRALIVPILLLLLAAPLLADRVVLTDGTDVEGRILALGPEGVRIRTADREFLLPRRIVREVHGSPPGTRVARPAAPALPGALLRLLREPEDGEELLARRLELSASQRKRVRVLLTELSPGLRAAIDEFSAGRRTAAARRLKDLLGRIEAGLAAILTDVQQALLEALLED
jgi:hypothetical protein